MTTPDISPDRPAVKGGDFRITEPGTYRMRSGGIVSLTKINHRSCEDPAIAKYEWQAISHDAIDGWPATWTSEGIFRTQDGDRPEDIVAGPFPDEAAPQADAKEFAGLTGYIGLVPNQDHLTWDTQTFVVRNYPVIIDLSTITKDQLVQPKPEPKRVNGWLNFFPNFILGPFATKAEADEAADRSVLIWKYPERIACIEVEFTEGEGLGAER